MLRHGDFGASAPAVFTVSIPDPHRIVERVKEGDVTFMLQRIATGDPAAAAELFPVVYIELRRLAAEKTAEASAADTVQPTALVHEAWLRLGGEDQAAWADRTRFFSAAAEAMRRILVERAREQSALAGAAGPHGIACDSTSAPTRGAALASPAADDEQLLLVDQALDTLAAHDADLAALVKLKFFAGHTLEDAADLLGLPPATARGQWAYARAWLFNEVKRLRRPHVPTEAHTAPLA